MMTTIFECETEVGKCAYESSGSYDFKYEEPTHSTIFAHTMASLNGHRGMLKIEQHCYLRCEGELPDQPWIKPEVSLEPVFGSKEDMIELARQMHEKFLERVRVRFPEEYFV